MRLKRKDERRSGKGNPQKRDGLLWRHTWHFRSSRKRLKEHSKLKRGLIIKKLKIFNRVFPRNFSLRTFYISVWFQSCPSSSAAILKYTLFVCLSIYNAMGKMENGFWAAIKYVDCNFLFFRLKLVVKTFEHSA